MGPRGSVGSPDVIAATSRARVISLDVIAVTSRARVVSLDVIAVTSAVASATGGRRATASRDFIRFYRVV